MGCPDDSSAPFGVAISEVGYYFCSFTKLTVGLADPTPRSYAKGLGAGYWLGHLGPPYALFLAG